ncbi:MAG: SGNH/GDSL hydrolase family protein [Chloroflexi bacterium]|nr:SGNH/GDSL hydrolase family protein [Chloroflexota bacterium]
MRAKVEKYLKNKDEATIIPDPQLGWAYKPNSVREDGGFTINGAGMRALREFALQPASDTLRIALFGDSFVAGAEVKDDEVWGYKLENLLNRAGFNTEVLNFGVGGYGMVQAFLRWRHQGADYSPDIVIFVFQGENLDRNVNVFQLLYGQAGVVYSRPRFILEDGQLALVNSPALPPEELMDAFAAFDSHPLAEHEAYYRGRDFASPLWDISRLAGLMYAVRDQLFPS